MLNYSSASAYVKSYRNHKRFVHMIKVCLTTLSCLQMIFFQQEYIIYRCICSETGIVFCFQRGALMIMTMPTENTEMYKVDIRYGANFQTSV